MKPDAHKVKFSRIGTGSDEEVITELKAGRPVILEVPGHWIAAIGLDSSGKILINDPYYRDRKTLDVYAGKVKSSVLFEQTDDLSAVVVTAPSNVRVRITDKEGRVVGTLNTGAPEEAAKEALTGIPGSSYSYREAWRDPTCVESPPPLAPGRTRSSFPAPRTTTRSRQWTPPAAPRVSPFTRTTTMAWSPSRPRTTRGRRCSP